MYRARDTKLGRVIALKILPAELASSPEALRRFELEARAASAMNHPNIVTIYDICVTAERAWIAMELIDGADLRTLAVKDPLTLKSALHVAVKLADGLAAAHDRGIVHRDLKPDNVMVTTDGFVKILDFGLAKQMRSILSDDTTIPHTSPGAVFGTVGYMSPEQTKGKEMDYRSDQFSFGVMLYEMLTRVRPFDRESKAESMAAIIRDEAEPPSSINEAVTYDLDRIVSRCLAKNPRDRYASTRDLARDLREVRDGLTQSSNRHMARPSSRRGPRDRWATWTRTKRAVIAAAAVLLLGGGVFYWLYGRSMIGQRVTSIAVVPFRDLNSTAEGRILADGISQLIAARLAEVRELRVSSPFDGARVSDGDDVRIVAAKRRVQAVVRGSVQRNGNDVRVTYALIDALTGRTLAADTATRAATDLFALEDVVAEDLLRELGRKAAPRTRVATAALGPDDQRRFIEAVGLLQRVKDERSVDRAIASLESILRNARDSGAVNALLARALLFKASLSGRPALIEQATVYATRGVALSGNDPDSHVTLGRLQNASGHYAEATASFQRALALRDDDADAVIGIAEALQGQGRDADAEQMFRKGLALQPDSSVNHAKFGGFCYRRSRYEEAALHFRKSTELLPDFARGFANLGAALQNLNRNDEALAAYRRSLAIEPTAAGWSNLGTFQFFLGRYAEAQKSYERAVQLAPSDHVMWLNLGDACRAAKSECATEAWKRAIAAGRAALELKANDAETRAMVASCLMKSGDADGAQREIRRALTDNPTSPEVLYQAAVIGALGGSHDSALSWLERAIRAGYPAAAAERDPMLESLRELPAFRNAVKSQA
ncbi:MAG: protein kinase [Acidobacteriota bacterium]|nr:protein kinase [Acidobacteriota bacterium]